MATRFKEVVYAKALSPELRSVVYLRHRTDPSHSLDD